MGRATRTIPPAIRRALEARDRGCTHPGCGRPHRWCDAHHITHWAAGGGTNLNNLRLLCRRHHRIAHEGNAPVPARE
ncbi:MAG: HNH endonuclease signature motif containing protein [Actinomycetota bacterium]